MTEDAYTPRYSLRTINGERIKTNPNEVYSDAAFWAEYEAIKRDLLAQGKPLYSDALKRDRQKRESRHVSRKLTQDDVRLIRATVTPKCSWKSPQVRDMAEQLGCQRETVVRVARYITHVGVK